MKRHFKTADSGHCYSFAWRLFVVPTRLNESLKCSFCKKKAGRFRRLIPSLSDAQSCICSECVAVCNSILETSMGDPKRQVGSIDVHCSFCKKLADEVRKLISSPTEYARCYICDECINACNSLLQDEPELLRRRGIRWLASLMTWHTRKSGGPYRYLGTRPV